MRMALPATAFSRRFLNLSHNLNLKKLIFLNGWGTFQPFLVSNKM